MSWIDKLGKAIFSHAQAKQVAKPSPAARPTRPRPSRTYQVSIVGESHYRAAIRRCRVGDIVGFVHEGDNAYDPRAIAVLSERGEKIGYLERDSWLHRALIDEGKACDAIIGFMGEVGGGNTGVSLDLRLGIGKTLDQMRDWVR